jgi:CheY-like chemotaxis protein
MVTHFDPGLGATRADPGQIEQVIMNLAINARDAMPRGGTLTIETQPVDTTQIASLPIGLKPGRYVSLAVRDTGVGMDQATLSHVFEPFFTTKETGKGTGLGLPTVYGIVKQSGGDISVESTPGTGTTIRVFLPGVEAAPQDASIAAPANNRARRDESLLLVEDEDAVRRIANTFLSSAGYRVLAAPNADEAIRLVQQGGTQIDLLVTDVVLPGGMPGTELAKRLRTMIPELKVVYMSGYPSGAIGHAWEAGSALLPKPFTRDSLTRSIREALDQ